MKFRVLRNNVNAHHPIKAKELLVKGDIIEGEIDKIDSLYISYKVGREGENHISVNDVEELKGCICDIHVRLTEGCQCGVIL